MPTSANGICASDYLSLKGDKMTTITFKRSGGLIGNELHLDLELDSLPEDEAQRLQQMIDEAGFFNIPENLAGRSTVDEFQYEITVDNGSAYHTVSATDTTMPKSLFPLVKELTLMRMLH
jgi:hypothetical protein